MAKWQSSNGPIEVKDMETKHLKRAIKTAKGSYTQPDGIQMDRFNLWLELVDRGEHKWLAANGMG